MNGISALLGLPRSPEASGCLLTKREAYNEINLLTKSIITPCPSCLVKRHKQSKSIERAPPFPTFPHLSGQITTDSRASKSPDLPDFQRLARFVGE